MREMENVVLTCDLPEYGLKEGDVGTVVLIHGKKEGFEVEFMTLNGETLAVLTFRKDQVRSIGDREIAYARAV